MKDDAQNAYEDMLEDIEIKTRNLRLFLDDMLWQIECADAEEPAWLRPAINRLRLLELLGCSDTI